MLSTICLFSGGYWDEALTVKLLLQSWSLEKKTVSRNLLTLFPSLIGCFWALDFFALRERHGADLLRAV